MARKVTRIIHPPSNQVNRKQKSFLKKCKEGRFIGQLIESTAEFHVKQKLYLNQGNIPRCFINKYLRSKLKELDYICEDLLEESPFYQ